MRNLKRKLTDEERFLAKRLWTSKEASVAQIAKMFRVNKPTILKVLGLWKKV